MFYFVYREFGLFEDLSSSTCFGLFIRQYLASWGIPFSLAEESFGFLEQQNLVVFEYEADGRLDRQRLGMAQEVFFPLRMIMA